MKESPHSTATLWRLLRKAYAVIVLYTKEFSWTLMPQNEPPKAQKFSHHMPIHPPLFHPLPLSTSHLVWKKKKKINFSFTRGKYSPQMEKGGSVFCTYTDRLTRSGWCFHKLRGLTLTQQRKSLCLWGITPIPISKKGYRGEEAYSLNDQKKGPSENRDLCHDHLQKGRMLSTFFSPKL